MIHNSLHIVAIVVGAVTCTIATMFAVFAIIKLCKKRGYCCYKRKQRSDSNVESGDQPMAKRQVEDMKFKTMTKLPQSTSKGSLRSGLTNDNDKHRHELSDLTEVSESSGLSVQVNKEFPPNQENSVYETNQTKISLGKTTVDVHPIDKKSIEKMPSNLNDRPRNDFVPNDDIRSNASKRSRNGKFETFSKDNNSDRNIFTAIRNQMTKDKESKTSSNGSLKNPPPKPERKESLAKDVSTLTAGTQTYLKANCLRKKSFKKVNEMTGLTDSDANSELSSSNGMDVKPTDKYRGEPIEPILVPYQSHSSSPSDYLSFGQNSHRNLWDCNRRDHFNGLYPRMERIIDISFDQIINTLDDYGKLDTIDETDGS